jgi:hypothetical protein
VRLFWTRCYVMSRVARIHFLPKLIHNLTVGKSSPKNVGCFCNFPKNAQSKQSPSGRKFAQSGHTAGEAFVDSLLCNELDGGNFMK